MFTKLCIWKCMSKDFFFFKWMVFTKIPFSFEMPVSSTRCEENATKTMHPKKCYSLLCVSLCFNCEFNKNCPIKVTYVWYCRQQRPAKCWGQFSVEANSVLRPVQCWGQFSFGASSLLRPVHCWDQFIVEATAEFLKVTVSRLCDRTKNFWLCSKSWDLYA